MEELSGNKHEQTDVTLNKEKIPQEKICQTNLHTCGEMDIKTRVTTRIAVSNMRMVKSTNMRSTRMNTRLIMTVMRLILWSHIRLIMR
jgi:hypothetical protein